MTPRLSRAAIVAALSFVALAPALRAQSPAAARPLDWEAIGNESVRTLADYLRIDTSNPPGNEMKGILFLKAILEREGIEAQILDTAELGATRGNLYARLKGTGRAKAIALVHHVDVVPATASYWTVPPFSGELRDGFVWGRGALDMKGTGIAHLMAMIAIKRSGIPLDRDIVFIANSDEELSSRGAIVFAQRHADLIRDVEYLLTEGGGTSVENGKLKYYGIGVAEKQPFWQRLTATGTPGHASRPTKNNAVVHLIAALDRLAQHETALRVTPGVARYMQAIADDYTGEQRAWLRDVQAALRDARGREWITSHAGWNAMLRNTITITVVNGSNKTNVIPPEATAEIDIRLLPGEDTAAVKAELERVVNDTSVRFTTLSTMKMTLDNPLETPLFHALESVARVRDPGVRIATPLGVGATDRPSYRALGLITYGFSPFRQNDGEGKGAHGNDERLSVRELKEGVKFYYDVLRKLDADNRMRQ